MRTGWISVLMVAVGVVAQSAAPAAAAPTRPAPPANGKPESAALREADRQIIVRFASQATPNDRAAARRAARVGFKRTMRTGSQIVHVRGARDVAGAVAALNRNPHVLYAERNARVQAFATPNDTFFTELYGLHNTAQDLLPSGNQAGLADADIDAPEAWDRQTGSSEIVVAVVDEGVAYDHPDLDGNLWTNSAEANGAPGTDDDSNGEVDDVKGVDYIDFDTDPKDFGGHGTHVAGTIAAEGNNALGTAGVVWDARIMPVRVLGGGGGSNEAVAAGFDYAGDMGADIVNASLGGSSFSQEISNAVSSHPDTLYVVAAGNGGADGNGDDNDITPQYPCNLPLANLICVAATGTSDDLTSFSNYGATSVDLAAPGEWILSALAERSASLRTDLFDANLNGWTTTDWIWHNDGGNGAATDSSGAFEYQDNASDIMTTSSALNLSGRTGCTMDMLLWTNIEPPFLDQNNQPTLADALWVDSSTDGGANWQPIALFYGDVQGPGSTYEFIEQIDLRADGAANARIRFRFETDSSVHNYDGAWIDGLQVTCTGAYDGNSYQYLDGTSMATPHVAGAAALLLSERPNLTVPQLRAALLSTGDLLPSLSDRNKLATQRRLNVETALDVVETYPEVSTEAATGITETAATLNGTVNPVGTATSYEFEYGVTASYGLKTPLGSAGSASVTGPVSAAVSGLVAGTTYHYRLVALRGADRFPGPDRTFQTLAATTTGGTTTGGTTTGGTTTGGTTTGGTLTPAEAVAAMKRTAKASCKRKGSKRTCKVTAQGATKVLISIKKGKRTAKGSGKPGKTIRLKGRLPRGRYTVKIVIIDAAGNRATIRRKFRL